MSYPNPEIPIDCHSRRVRLPACDGIDECERVRSELQAAQRLVVSLDAENTELRMTVARLMDKVA